MIAQQVNFGFGLLTVGINSQRRVGVGLSGEGGGGEESMIAKIQRREKS